MAHCFAKVLEEEIEEAFFYPCDLVKLILKQLSPSGLVKSGGYIPRRFACFDIIFIHHYSPPLRGIVVYYCE